jgi:cytochrome c biogenesis protein CcmG, thiol:disulfide interchange protein DsbE
MYKTIITFCALVLTGLFTILSNSLFNESGSVKNSFHSQKVMEFEVAQIDANLESDNLKKMLSLKGFLGKPTVINFWSSWCMSCKSEAAILQRFWEQNKDQGIKIVGISIQDQVSDVKNAIKLFKKTYPIGIDLSGNTAIDYGVTGVPETFFLDKKGVISYKHTGPLTWEILEKQTKKLL